MNAQDTMDAINQFLSAANQIEEYWSQLYDEVGKTDRETQDLLHELELSRFNACNGFSLAARMQEIRKRRRRSKNEKEVIEPFKQWADKHKSIVVDLHKVLKAMGKAAETQQTRQYHPRELDDLRLDNRRKEAADSEGA